jgi:toxin ParE1/3/4
MYNRGRRRDELSPSLQRFPIDDYLIFYRLIEGGVEVVRVVRGYRHLDALFDDRDEDKYSTSNILVPRLS